MATTSRPIPWEWSIKFSDKVKDVNELVKYVTAKFAEEGLHCHQKGRLLFVGAPEEELEEEAQFTQMLKEVEPRERQYQVSHEEFTMAEKAKFVKYGEATFFTLSERNWLLLEILDKVKPDEGFQKFASMSQFQSREGDVGHFTLLGAMDMTGMIEFSGPVHQDEARWKLWARMMTPHELLTLPWVNKKGDILDEVRDYYGEGVAFYFAWMKFYTQSLLVPGILGLICWIMGPDGVNVDNSATMPFFALVMVLWSFFFVKGWQRQSITYAHRWNSLKVATSSLIVDIRPGFHGTLQTCPITGEQVLHYKAWKRRLKYIVSISVTLVMLAIAFTVMVGSLNLQGYVSEFDKQGHKNPFHIPFLQQFSQPGAIFDPASPIMALVPVMIHTVIIMILNQMIYRRIANALTTWENHKTDESHQNALILKRFLFEAFDCYIALFYLAFYECDVLRLQQELQALYMTDCIRRVMTETALPMFIHTYGYISKIAKAEAQSKKDDDDDSAPAPEIKGKVSKKKAKRDSVATRTKYLSAETIKAVQRAAEDIEAAEPYEQFDDYLEMVIQFGYITLFASVFPLAGILSIVTNCIELRSDACKLAIVARRPKVTRPSSIGTWETVVFSIAWLAALTNTIIFGFVSEQMMQWTPEWFERVRVHSLAGGSNLDDQALEEGSGRYVVGIVFLLEHGLIFVGILILTLVKSMPKPVRVDLQRRQYATHERNKQLRTMNKMKRALTVE